MALHCLDRLLQFLHRHILRVGRRGGAVVGAPAVVSLRVQRSVEKATASAKAVVAQPSVILALRTALVVVRVVGAPDVVSLTVQRSLDKAAASGKAVFLQPPVVVARGFRGRGSHPTEVLFGGNSMLKSNSPGTSPGGCCCWCWVGGVQVEFVLRRLVLPDRAGPGRLHPGQFVDKGLLRLLRRGISHGRCFCRGRGLLLDHFGWLYPAAPLQLVVVERMACSRVNRFNPPVVVASRARPDYPYRRHHRGLCVLHLRRLFPTALAAPPVVVEFTA